MSRVLVLIPSFILFLVALLIVLPAPLYILWMVDVGVSEWSVWLGLLGIFGLVAGLIGVRHGWGTIAIVILLLNAVTVVCASLPVITAFQAARQAGVQLSWRRYLQGWPGDPTVQVEHDVTFAAPGGAPLKLDVYRPAVRPAAAPMPVVIVVHGGSWAGGVKSDFATYDRWLAAGGRVVFDVEYRLATAEHRFPTQVADVKCAIGWVKQHAADYGADGSRVALFGRSAGGQLALLAAYTPNDPALPPSCAAADTSVKAVISLYGPTDLAWGYTHPARPDILHGPQVLENYLGGSPSTVPEQYALAAPIEHVGPQTPPTLFFHGGHDQLVGAQHAQRIIPKLQMLGIPYEYTYLPWATHGFDYNFNGWGSQIVQARVDSFLQRYLVP